MRKNFRSRKDLHLERMFDTRSEAWERVGLAVDVSQRAVRKAQREALVLVPLLVGVLVVYDHRKPWLHITSKSQWETPLQIATVIALVALGWAFSRDVGRAAAPTFFRRLDPVIAGMVLLSARPFRGGELIRLQAGAVGGSV